MEKKILFAFLILVFACKHIDEKVSPVIVESPCDRQCYYINASDYSTLSEAINASDSLGIQQIIVTGYWKQKGKTFVKDTEADLKASRSPNGIIINDNHGRIEIK